MSGQRTVSLSNCSGCLSCDGCLHNGEGSTWCLIRESSWKTREGLAGLTTSVTISSSMFSESPNITFTVTPQHRGPSSWLELQPYLWFEILTVTVPCMFMLPDVSFFSPSSCRALGCMMRRCNDVWSWCGAQLLWASACSLWVRVGLEPP